MVKNSPNLVTLDQMLRAPLFRVKQKQIKFQIELKSFIWNKLWEIREQRLDNLKFHILKYVINVYSLGLFS
jgi:hypothetical protein